LAWKHTPDTNDHDLPLYNSRILKLYIDYLEKKHPLADIEAILAFARVRRYELDDLGHWFSQRQVDRFQESVEQQVADRDVARKAGRHAALSQTGGPARQYVLSLVNPTTAYLLMPRLYRLWSKGATVAARRLGRNQVEIKTRPAPGVAEKYYQCANRTGTLEALAALFTGKLAHIQHDECFHRGGACCRYVVSWIPTPAMTWKLLQNLILPVGVLATAIGFYALPFYQGLQLLTLSAAAWLAVGYYTEKIKRADLARRIDIQGNAAQDLLAEIDAHTNDALITKEIGQAATGVTDVDELLAAVVGILEQHLNYDRGILMLADEEQDHLEFRAGFGHSREDEGYLAGHPFALKGAGPEEFAVKVFKEKQAFLTNNLAEVKARFPEHALAAAEKLGVNSFICLPLIYKDKAIGILAVESIHQRRPYRTRDLNFLLGITSQIAASITNVRTLKKLAENELQYHTLFDTAISSLYVFGDNGKLIDINASTKAMHGYTLAEMQTLSSRDLIHADSLEDFDSFFDTVSSGRTFIGAGKCLHKNGSVIEVEFHGRAFTIGGQHRFLLSIRDITARKKAEREKQEVQEKLARAKKMEALGLLAGGVAHDLNNILSGLVSYPELLLMDLPEDSPLRKPIEIILSSGERAAAVVADLVTIARGAASSREVVNINSLVEEYLVSPEYATLKTIYPRVHLYARLAPDLPNTSCSTIHLKKALTNLVINAAEAMEDSGEICIATSNRYLDKPLKGYDDILVGKCAVLSVSDQGDGITPEEIERIFEPFYSRKILGRGGTGLGLTIVWNTLQDHQGYIDVISSSGGTKFHLYFPVTRKPVATGPIPRRPVADYRGNGETILVVDDEENQRLIAGELLKKLGYTVTTRPDGESALLYLQARQVDLLVLDMIMEPGMNGRETYAAALEIHPGQKAIIASGYSETEEVKAALRLGAGQFIKKPYTLETIGMAVKQALAAG